jgi:hypothetical protein
MHWMLIAHNGEKQEWQKGFQLVLLQEETVPNSSEHQCHMDV